MFALLLNVSKTSALLDSIPENNDEYSTITESETEDIAKPVLNLTGYKKINFTADLNLPEDELVAEMICLVKNEFPNYEKYYDMNYVQQTVQSNAEKNLITNKEVNNGFIPDEVDSKFDHYMPQSNELTRLIMVNAKLANTLKVQTLNTYISNYIEYANCYSIMRELFLNELRKYNVDYDRDLYGAIERCHEENKETIPVLQYFTAIGKKFHDAKINRKIVQFRNNMRQFRNNQIRIDRMINTAL